MKFTIQLILFFFSLHAFSQNKLISKSIARISKADTVYFTVDNSGCFLAYILEVKMCKQKSGGRLLIMRTEKNNEVKSLSAKEYKAFIKNYDLSYNHFMNIDPGKCTSTSEFELMDKISKDKVTSARFKNTTCEAEFNPEMFLQDIFRSQTSNKK